MGNRNFQDESILAALLESNEDLSSADTDSELEDHMREDDAQSDVEEVFVDEERDQESIAPSLPLKTLSKYYHLQLLVVW